jgi:hypothetical protein
MDKEKQQAAKKKGGQQPRGGVIKNVVKDVVKTAAYACQGNSK